MGVFVDDGISQDAIADRIRNHTWKHGDVRCECGQMMLRGVRSWSEHMVEEVIEWQAIFDGGRAEGKSEGYADADRDYERGHKDGREAAFERIREAVEDAEP
jgi:hypothetical protein